jgi:hypothetical protein
MDHDDQVRMLNDYDQQLADWCALIEDGPDSLRQHARVKVKEVAKARRDMAWQVLRTINRILLVPVDLRAIVGILMRKI